MLKKTDRRVKVSVSVEIIYVQIEGYDEFFVVSLTYWHNLHWSGICPYRRTFVGIRRARPESKSTSWTPYCCFCCCKNEANKNLDQSFGSWFLIIKGRSRNSTYCLVLLWISIIANVIFSPFFYNTQLLINFYNLHPCNTELHSLSFTSDTASKHCFRRLPFSTRQSPAFNAAFQCLSLDSNLDHHVSPTCYNSPSWRPSFLSFQYIINYV